MVDNARLEHLLAYASPFAQSSPVLEPVAQPLDFLDMDPMRYKWLFDDAQLTPSREDLTAALKRDHAPIPAPENREGYSRGRDFGYWISGYLAYLNVCEMAARQGVIGGRYLDFGGSTGRLFRHFLFQGDAFDVWSCDFKTSSVQWNLLHYPQTIKAFQNMYHPFLPLEDNSFDLITAMSVFTHIDETETSWLLELRRVLKPGSIALITIHDEQSWKTMPDYLRSRVIQFRPDLAGIDELPEGRQVSTHRTDDPLRCLVFHSRSFIRRQWSRYFDVLDIVPGRFGFQSAVLLRKPI